jgi:hypothetical protein
MIRNRRGPALKEIAALPSSRLHLKPVAPEAMSICWISDWDSAAVIEAPRT